jgi:branched-chain amino acid transport system substrate-binding protein
MKTIRIPTMSARVTRRVVTGGGLAALAAPFVRTARAAEPLRLGVLVDMSSWGRDTGGMGSTVAAQMAVEELGGLAGGRPVEFLSGDHRMNPDLGVQIARDWFDNQDVQAIVDVPMSALGLAISGFCKQKNRLALLSGPGASSITNQDCNANTVQFTYDTYALAHVIGAAMVAEGAKTWFFITADYSFGHQLQADATAFIEKAGGKVLGHSLHPPGASDFSAVLLAAQASKADVVALANAAQDTNNAIKQAAEFGIGQRLNGQRIAALLMFITYVPALGLKTAQGIMLTTASYWDLNAETRAWSERFFARTNVMPSMEQTGTYGVVLHYLKAVAKVGTDPQAVMAEMRKMPINDAFVKNGYLRIDGRVIRDMYLARIKSPEESKGPWDYYDIVRTVKGEDAFRPLADSLCPLVKKT